MGIRMSAGATLLVVVVAAAGVHHWWGGHSSVTIKHLSLDSEAPVYEYFGLRNVLTTPDTVPTDVRCIKHTYCDRHNVCAIVCQRGNTALALNNVEISTSSGVSKINLRIPTPCQPQFRYRHCKRGYGIEDQVYNKLLKLIRWVGTKSHIATNNQLFTLTDQLNFGVRMIEIDTHWVKEKLRVAHCGGVHSQPINMLVKSLNILAKLFHYEIQWDTETIGCSPSASSIPADEERTLQSALEEIQMWLAQSENQDEFLVIFFDDQMDLSRWHKVPILKQIIKSLFPRETIFSPEDQAEDGWVPLEALIKSGKRIMFVSRTDYGVSMEDLIFFRKKVCQWAEPDLPFYGFPACHFSSGEMSNGGSILRPISSEIQFGPFNSEGHLGPNTGVLNETNIPPLIKCNVNFPSPDNITPKRMMSFVWSWAVNEPSVPIDFITTCPALFTNDSRWRAMSCDTAAPQACLSDTVTPNQWSLGTPMSGRKIPVRSSCPNGTKFVVPPTAYDNSIIASLGNALQFDYLWINITTNTP